MMAAADIVVQIETMMKQIRESLAQLLAAEQELAVMALLLLIGVIAGMILYHLVVINYKNYRVKRIQKRANRRECCGKVFAQSWI